MEATGRRVQLFSRLIHSFSLKLFFLAFILLTVPLILYRQFQSAEQKQLELLRNAANQTGHTIAAMLRPRFAAFSSESPAALREALAAAATGDSNVKILVRLAGANPDDFIYIASTPPLSEDYLKRERRDLIQSGIFQRLAPTCDYATDLALQFVNPAGTQEVLTSMTPVHIGGSCWIVITSQNAASLAPGLLNASFWTNPAMRATASIYFLSAALVIWLFIHMWRNVSRFRTAARRIRMRGTGAISFHELNTIPELTRVAEDFDSLVGALMASQAFIKRTAEENAHAFKAPLAVIAQSIEPLRRVVVSSDATAQRSLHLIERSVAKLDTLVSAVRDFEEAAAETVYPVRRPVNLSEFLARMLSDYAPVLATQEKRLAISIVNGVSVYANDDLLETIIENILDNAVSFTRCGGVIEIDLRQNGNRALLRIGDRGPGVDAERLSLIFERYVSLRPNAPPDKGIAPAAEWHQGLGLWIVRRNVEALGGTVTGRNRAGGGFEVIVSLMTNR
jgi:two-component system, OmpR family, sensor histidine kinase ChvG